MAAPDLDTLRSWIGRTESDEDVAAVRPAVLLAGTLDRDTAPKAGDPLPPTWHWLYFLPATRLSDVGEDGHPRRGSLMPPVPLPRRMWAASRLELRSPIRLGDTLRRRTTIADVQAKQGRSGALVFVRVVAEIATERGMALIETRDIVFREDSTGAPPPAPAAPSQAQWHETRTADPVLLFRYSALTFNSHRIHYDRSYATGVEGYPGIVVQGPLLATLLAEALCRSAQRAPSSVSFRAVSPLFAGSPFRLGGNATSAWAASADGRLAMSAEMELA